VPPDPPDPPRAPHRRRQPPPARPAALLFPSRAPTAEGPSSPPGGREPRTGRSTSRAGSLRAAPRRFASAFQGRGGTKKRHVATHLSRGAEGGGAGEGSRRSRTALPSRGRLAARNSPPSPRPAWPHGRRGLRSAALRRGGEAGEALAAAAAPVHAAGARDGGRFATRKIPRRGPPFLRLSPPRRAGAGADRPIPPFGLAKRFPRRGVSGGAFFPVCSRTPPPPRGAGWPPLPPRNFRDGGGGGGGGRERKRTLGQGLGAKGPQRRREGGRGGREGGEGDRRRGFFRDGGRARGGARGARRGGCAGGPRRSPVPPRPHDPPLPPRPEPAAPPAPVL